MFRQEQIEIPEENPFKNCLLDRKKYGVLLTELVKTYNDGFVMTINNDWGTGKTTFVKMWQEMLNTKEYSLKTIYFNAWENDFQEDVDIALMSHLKELEGTSDSDFNSVLSKGAHIFKKGSSILLKGILRKVLGEKTAEEAVEAVTEISATDVSERLENYLDRKDCLLDFQNALKDYIEKSTDSLPLVFFIDELDRCKPSYAVEVLETIKHVFAVPGIVFVLSINKDQLGKAIAGYYGNTSMDTDDYLKRFIDLEFTLPAPDIERFVNVLIIKYNFIKLFSNEDWTQPANPIPRPMKEYMETCYLICHAYDLKLRDLEKIFPRIRLTFPRTSAFNTRFHPVLILLAILHDKDRLLLKSIQSSTFQIEEFIENLDTKMKPLLNLPQDKHHIIVDLFSTLILFYRQQLIEEQNLSSLSLFRPDSGGELLTDLKILEVYQPKIAAILKKRSSSIETMRLPKLNHFIENYSLTHFINKD